MKTKFYLAGGVCAASLAFCMPLGAQLTPATSTSPAVSPATSPAAKPATRPIPFHGKISAVDQTAKTRDGRTTARVTCNGTDAGAEQVRRGMAWAIEGNDTLDSLQSEARAARRGLWAQVQPVPPWDWRSSAKH